MVSSFPQGISYYDYTAFDGEAQNLESVEYPFIAIIPRSTMIQRVVPVKVLSMVQIDLFENYLYLKALCKKKYTQKM